MDECKNCEHYETEKCIQCHNYSSYSPDEDNEFTVEVVFEDYD